MISNVNRGVFTGILEDSSNPKGIGCLSLYDNQMLYIGQVLKTEEGVLMHGYGKVIDTIEKFKYTGKFKYGTINGYGEMKMGEKTNCDIEQGYLKKIEKNEERQLINSSQKILSGTWRNGKLIEGRIVKDGKIYEGNFFDSEKINGE